MAEPSAAIAPPATATASQGRRSGGSARRGVRMASFRRSSSAEQTDEVLPSASSTTDPAPAAADDANNPIDAARAPPPAKPSRRLLASMPSFRRPSSAEQTDEVSPASSATDPAPAAADDADPTDFFEYKVDIMSQAIALCRHIAGLYGLELYHFDNATGKLVNVGLGPSPDADEAEAPTEADVENQDRRKAQIYVKRRTQESDPDNDYYSGEAADAYERLTNRNREDYLEAAPLEPGRGLAGLLWSEMSGGQHHGGHGGVDSLVWREVREIADDPDQPHDERLQTLAKAGFTLASGIPFDSNGYKGMAVIYGNPHGSPAKLRNPINIRYMVHIAQLLGSAAALQTPLAQQKELRKLEAYNNWHRLKIKLMTIVWFGGANKGVPTAKVESRTDGRAKLERKSSLAKLSEASAQLRTDFKKAVNETRDSAKAKVVRWVKKCRGGNASVPPAFTWSAALWSFFGILITHLTLSGINVYVGKLSEGDLKLVLAPLGALTTLQYNLTAAPASQPRNAFFGQLFAITASICLSYIKNVPKWFRPVLAPAIVIPAMARLGITHPPAGAAAIVFASGALSWDTMGIFMIGVCVAILNAVIINNMNDKRQYPTSWPLMKRLKKSIVKQLGWEEWTGNALAGA